MHKDSSIELKKTSITQGQSYILPFFEGKLALSSDYKALDGLTGGAITQAISNGFKGEKSEMKLISPAQKLHSVLLLGLGKEETFTHESAFDMFADALKGIRNTNSRGASVLIDALPIQRKSYVLAISSLVGLHRLTKFKTKGLEKTKNLDSVTLMSSAPEKHQKDFAEGVIIATQMNKIRDLVNTPPNISTTLSLSDYAKEIAQKNKLACTILDEKKMAQMGMGMITAVGKGSDTKPRMALLEYSGAGKEKPVLLVGKGITFDSGGYNLKPSSYITTMKDDKAGAVTVLHVIEAVSKMNLKVNVVAVLAIAENLVSGGAYRPDDVLTAYNGMTVEITNTDAEGRLVLGDALSYAIEKYKPQAVIDIATLTGAALIALGSFTTSLISNNDKIAEEVKKAASNAGERVWQLPLWEEHGENLKSDIADIKNATEVSDAGVIIGGYFLKQFVGDAPWVHLDIGSTVWSKAEKGMKQKGATAVGCRTLYEFVKLYAK